MKTHDPYERDYSQASHRGEQPQQESVVVPFGEGIKRRRKYLNIPQTDLAAQLGIDPTTVVKYEARIRPPRDNEIVDRMARIFGTTRQELLDGRIPLSMVGLTDFVSTGGTATRAVLPPAHSTLPPLTPTLPTGEDVLAEGEVGEIIADVLALEVLAPEHIPTIAALVRALRRTAERGEL